MRKRRHIENLPELGKISPSDLSRNFSGTSAFYTPPFLIECILRSTNHLLQQNFMLPLGICSDQVECLDPSAGMLGFASSHLQFAHSILKSEEFAAWMEKSFTPQHYAFELDSSIKSVATQKIQAVYSSLKNPSSKDHISGEHALNVTHSDASPQNEVFPHFYIRNPLENPQASEINNHIPPCHSDRILLVYGNPPYAVNSYSKSDWITSLVEAYKLHLNRPGKKNIVGLKGIQDEYVKFIRYSQWLLADRDKSGILAFVVNNYFLDGDIFRGMRHSLLTSFEELYIINLYGDPKKSKPVNFRNKSNMQNFELGIELGIELGGEKDENLFDVQTGICIFIALRKSGKEKSRNSFAKVHYCGCYGSKTRKRAFCSLPFTNLPFQPVTLRSDYEFIPISPEMITLEREYDKFPYLAEIFNENIIGVQSLHDSLITHPDKESLTQILTKFYDGTYDSQIIRDKRDQRWVKSHGVIFHDARDWKISDGKQGTLKKAINNIQLWQWRGMDRWWVSYDEHLITKGSSSFSLMQFMYSFQQNVAITIARSSRKASGENSVFLTSIIAESHCVEGGSGIGDYIFPLRYNSQRPKNSNWNQPLKAEEYNLSAQFLSSLPPEYYTIPEDIFAYIYAILWTPLYRTMYQPLIKRDFPHIPFPEHSDYFQKYAELGKILIDLHGFFSHSARSPQKKLPQSNFPLLDITEMNFSQSDTRVPIVRNPLYNAAEQRIYFDGKHPESSFWIGKITPEIWNFEIGGYPQIQQYLAHRKFGATTPKPPSQRKKYQFSRALNSEEIAYLLHMCAVIGQTLRLLPHLDKIFTSIEGKWYKFKKSS